MLACFCKVKMVESAPGTTPDCVRSSPAQSTAYKDIINNVHAMSGSIAALLKDAFFWSKTCMPRQRFAQNVCRKRSRLTPPLTNVAQHMKDFALSVLTVLMRFKRHTRDAAY